MICGKRVRRCGQLCQGTDRRFQVTGTQLLCGAGTQSSAVVSDIRPTGQARLRRRRMAAAPRARPPSIVEEGSGTWSKVRLSIAK